MRGLVLSVCVLAVTLFSSAGMGRGYSDVSVEVPPAVWLARSCVGEAGWRAHATGECAAILHVYRKRGAVSGITSDQMAMLYSAAIKRHEFQRRPWIFGLDETGDQPSSWPSHLMWGHFREDWDSTLALAEAFLRGEVEDPLPEAEHYGGWVDRYRAKRYGMRRLKAPKGFRNRFYLLPSANLSSRVEVSLD